MIDPEDLPDDVREMLFPVRKTKPEREAEEAQLRAELELLQAEASASIPWSHPDADPLKDMHDAGEASRKSWPFL